MNYQVFLIFVVISASWAQMMHQKSLIIAFDGTGSMNSSLQQLKRAAKDIVEKFATRPDKPIYNYVLTVFNDPCEYPS